MTAAGFTESIIENDLGCGAFQIIIISCTLMSVIPAYFSVMMMSFGSYNPGWTCLDNGSFHIHVNETNIRWRSSPDNQTTDYRKDLSCQLFKTCQHVEFDPETSTVVTEWGLICDRAWVSSLIISIQMAGVLIGLFFSGQLADNIGRKMTFFGSLFFVAVLNFVSIFSSVWQMFAVLRFFIGLAYGGVMSLYFVYSSEFLTKKWRAPLSGFPAWNTAGILLGVLCMILKDWRGIHISISIIAVLCFLPVLWFPESLRWLEVKGKSEQFKLVAKKMASLNGKVLPPIDMNAFANQEKSDSLAGGAMKYTILDLFRPGYKLISVAIAVNWFSVSTVYISVLFGVKALGGDIYISYIVINAVTIPLMIIPTLAPNIIGRKRTLFACCCVSSVCFGVATCFELMTTENIRGIGTLIFIVCAVAAVDTSKPTMILTVSEIYPTVVRGLGMSWACSCGRIGTVIAPFLIPSDRDTIYIWYLILGFLLILSCCAIRVLPETKDKPIKQTFDEYEIRE